ncbi:hypothetical protein D9758_008915 [Tetrapyrgos nigripes]|uniref:Uncharacterized protein n=1 Tax=Tetrapyrgos nigripes TaxID=182062 RepID=A0A8H5GK40_9AGAR|nr:hypothetical protein D9758_008915 [Tetrapyrgos nigripes]
MTPLCNVGDQKLHELMLAGRPQASFPNCQTVAKDLDTAFHAASGHIHTLLKEYPGQLSFTTDAWTSPNHYVFEVPESHTGKVMAQEFEQMLMCFGLAQRILSFTGENALSNDTQTDALDESTKNSFKKTIHVQCFNHTLNLAAKTLLGGFLESDDDVVGEEENKDEIEHVDDSIHNNLQIPDVDADDVNSLPSLQSFDLSDDESDIDSDHDDTSSIESVDEVGRLSPEVKEIFERESLKLKVAVKKIHGLSFAIIHSTTIGLPAWLRVCQKNELKPRLIPQDVKTRWNSTFESIVQLWTTSLEQRTCLTGITTQLSPTCDELAEYLLQPLETTKDPLGWWWPKQVVFPVLSQMALGYHSVPGFSIQKFLYFGSWSRKDLFNDKLVVDALVAEDEKRKGKEKLSPDL